MYNIHMYAHSDLTCAAIMVGNIAQEREWALAVETCSLLLDTDATIYCYNSITHCGEVLVACTRYYITPGRPPKHWLGCLSKGETSQRPQTPFKLPVEVL